MFALLRSQKQIGEVLKRNPVLPSRQYFASSFQKFTFKSTTIFSSPLLRSSVLRESSKVNLSSISSFSLARLHTPRQVILNSPPLLFISSSLPSRALRLFNQKRSLSISGVVGFAWKFCIGLVKIVFVSTLILFALSISLVAYGWSWLYFKWKQRAMFNSSSSSALPSSGSQPFAPPEFVLKIQNFVAPLFSSLYMNYKLLKLNSQMLNETEKLILQKLQTDPQLRKKFGDPSEFVVYDYDQIEDVQIQQEGYQIIYHIYTPHGKFKVHAGFEFPQDMDMRTFMFKNTGNDGLGMKVNRMKIVFGDGKEKDVDVDQPDFVDAVVVEEYTESIEEKRRGRKGKRK